ncbi:MAG: helicase IV [Campylobacter sp.]
MDKIIFDDAKTAIIILLCIILVFIVLKILNKPKIKQSRYKSDSGDLVRSRAELVVANWLFYHNLKFIYEKKPPIKQRIISDFYLSEFDIYIEFWGLQTGNYIKRKKEKIKIYKKNSLKLIEMNDDSLRNLSVFFTKEFNKFGVNLM